MYRNDPILSMILLGCLIAFGFGAASGSESEKADEIIGLFMAPCCKHSYLKDHTSGGAEAMKAEIAAYIEEGKGEEEIRQIYVGKYGEIILAEPVPEGINRLAVIAPIAALLAGLVVAVSVVRHQRRHGDALKESGRIKASPPPDSNDDEIERLIREGDEQV